VGPWLSPKLVTVNIFPKLLPDIIGFQVDIVAAKKVTGWVNRFI